MNSHLHSSKAAFSFALLLVAAISVAGCGSQGGPSSATVTVYDRVIEGGTIRSAYIIYPPGATKDPNTGKLSGISVETIEAAAMNLGLKIEWTEEVAWGSMIEGLLADRYDLVVSGIWPNASRAKQVDFSSPLFYSGIGAYVRPADVRRFGVGLSAINSPDFRVATIDGEMSDIIRRSQFPQSQADSLPQTADVSQLLLNVTQGKADVTFVEPYIALQFLAKNPGSITNLVPETPLRVFGNTVMFRRGQFEFKAMLNTAIEELLNNGDIDLLIEKYETFPGALYRTARPYRTNR